MRKKLFFILTFLILLVLVACSRSASVTNKNASQNKDVQDIPTISTSANYKMFREEPPLFDDADLVVIAETNTSFEEREHILNYVERDGNQEGLPPALSGFYTKTPVKILKVLKQPDSESIQENEELKIMEPISLIEEDAAIKKLSVEDYKEIEADKKYVLYLKKNAYGDYGVINMNNGKFNLESESLNMSALDSIPEEEQQKHEDLKRSVEQRFSKEIEDAKDM